MHNNKNNTTKCREDLLLLFPSLFPFVVSTVLWGAVPELLALEWYCLNCALAGHPWARHCTFMVPLHIQKKKIESSCKRRNLLSPTWIPSRHTSSLSIPFGLPWAFALRYPVPGFPWGLTYTSVSYPVFAPPPNPRLSSVCLFSIYFIFLYRTVCFGWGKGFLVPSSCSRNKPFWSCVFASVSKWKWVWFA